MCSAVGGKDASIEQHALFKKGRNAVLKREDPKSVNVSNVVLLSVLFLLGATRERVQLAPGN